MKRALCLLLTSLVLVSTTACSNSKETENLNKYKPGVYTITTKGMHKSDMVIDVTFDETSITDIKVVDHKETYGIGYGLDTTPIEVIPNKIVETQNLNIDTITGATLTSTSLLNAVKDAVTQAGGNPEALLIESETNKSENKTFDVDVVVVGGGVSGLSAAIEAATNGADVLILEKQGIVGGATSRSGGKIIANNTETQKSLGIEDSNELMFNYLKEVGGELINEEKLKKFVYNSLNNFNWMVDMGVDVQDVEPIHSSLNPWRVHNTRGGGGMTDGHGGQIIVPMMKKYQELDGDVIYNVTANELLTNDNNEIIGVKGINKDGSTVTVNAKSVILATGGFTSNKEMMAKYDDFTEGYSAQVPVGNVGDGIKMAESVGGQIFENPSVQTVYVSRTSGVGINEESGLIVKEDGKRFVNEYTYQYHIGDTMRKEKSSLGYYIATSTDPNPTVQFAMSLDSTACADSIEELAKIIEVDPATLKSTVDRYNELCDKGIDEDFGKPSDKMYPIKGEKYYAIKLSPSATVTFSGIVTDLESRVLDSNNSPIKGLYAAGETAFPGLFGTEYPGCGVAISSGSYYGRVAGENAAKEN